MTTKLRASNIRKKNHKCTRRNSYDGYASHLKDSLAHRTFRALGSISNTKSVSLTFREGQSKECIGTLTIRQLNINDTIIIIVLGNNYVVIGKL